MLKVELVNDKTNEVFTTVELEDEIVEKIEKLGMTIEEGIKRALDYVVKNPNYFEKIAKIDKYMKEKK